MFLGLRIIQSCLRFWVHKVYGALGSKILQGLERIGFIEPQVHKVCGALGS